MSEPQDLLRLFEALNSYEVFTPPAIARQILDELPPSLWENDSLRALDPCCKSGVFLREMLVRICTSRVAKSRPPAAHAKSALKDQLFGIAISELTGYMSRRTLYGVMSANSEKVAGDAQMSGRNDFNKYYSPKIFAIPEYADCPTEGNIFYPAEEVSRKTKRAGLQTLEDTSFPFIQKTEHAWIERIKSQKTDTTESGMKFDVIVGNPPYQIQKGGNNVMPVYHKFVAQAITLAPTHLAMIIPARWFTETSREEIAAFRRLLVSSKHVRKLVYYPNAKDCFAGVDVAGGVCYFVWERDYVGKCEFVTMSGAMPSSSFQNDLTAYDIVLKSEEAVSILEKVFAKQQGRPFLDSVVSSQEPFIVAKTNAFKKAATAPFPGSIKFYGNRQMLRDTQGVGYVARNLVTRNVPLIDKHKVLVSKANGASIEARTFMSRPILAESGSICSETYLVLSAFDTKKQASNFLKYAETKFFRYLLSLRKSTQNTTSKAYSFVPCLDMKQTWTDDDLFNHFGLSSSEREFIRSAIAELPR